MDSDEYAIRKATNQLLSIPAASRANRQSIVLFTDGSPNVVTLQSGEVRFNLTQNLTVSDPDTLSAGIDVDTTALTTMPANAVGAIPTTGRLPISPGTPLSPCAVVRASINVAENAAQQARQNGITVYAIGFGARLNQLELPLGGQCELNSESNGASVLRRIANVSNVGGQNPFHVAIEPMGDYCPADNDQELQNCFAQLAQKIRFAGVGGSNSVKQSARHGKGRTESE